jgi:hypothetical protein
MVFHSQLAHCLITLCRLSTFESTSIPWDFKRVRQERDLGDLARLWGETWLKIPQASGLVMDAGDNEMSPWVITRKKLEPVAKWWDTYLAAEAEREAMEAGGAGGLLDTDQMHLQGYDFSMLNGDHSMEDIWVSDIFGQGGDLFGGQQF